MTLTSPAKFSETIEDLDPDTTYRFRALVRKLKGDWDNGDILRFTTNENGEIKRRQIVSSFGDTGQV